MIYKIHLRNGPTFFTRIKLTRHFILLFFLLNGVIAFAQKDTLITDKGVAIYGNIKSLHHGILNMSADFADGNVKVKWKKVKQIYMHKNRRIFDSEGIRYVGKIIDTEENADEAYIIFDSDTIKINYEEIVEIQELKDSFRKRLKLGINFGYGDTRANSTRNLNIRANFGYTADAWELSTNINSFANAVDTVVTSRAEIAISFRRYIFRRWFALINLNSLSSDQQQLKSRVTGSLGFGNDLIRNQRMELLLSTGATYNKEEYYEEVLSEDRYLSYELFASLDYVLFDIKEFDVTTNLTGLPSLTDQDRIRVNYNLDFKWDIIKSVNLKLGYTLNYDSKPPADTRKNDYIFSLTFGWSLK